jgi:hypothetical protein
MISITNFTFYFIAITFHLHIQQYITVTTIYALPSQFKLLITTKKLAAMSSCQKPISGATDAQKIYACQNFSGASSWQPSMAAVRVRDVENSRPVSELN